MPLMAKKRPKAESVEVDLRAARIRVSFSDDELVIRPRDGRDRCLLLAYAIALATKRGPFRDSFAGLTRKWLEEVDEATGGSVFDSWGFSRIRRFRNDWSRDLRRPTSWVPVKFPSWMDPKSWKAGVRAVLRDVFLSEPLGPERGHRAGCDGRWARYFIPEATEITLVPEPAKGCGLSKLFLARNAYTEEDKGDVSGRGERGEGISQGVAEDDGGFREALEAYCGEILGRYEFVIGVASQKALLRKDFYIHRRLAAATGETQRPYDETREDDLSGRSGAVTHAQAELMRRLCSSSALRVCVTGDAGAGKSTLLGHFAWQLADRYLGQPEQLPRRVPVPVDLGRWGAYEARCRRREKHTGDDHAPSLIGLACYCNRRLDRELLERLCCGGEAVFLLDGVDEARSSADIEPLGLWMDGELRSEPIVGCSTVLAGRPAALRREPQLTARFDELKLEELKAREINRYVHDYFRGDSQRGDRLRRHLRQHSSIRKLVGCPLLLTLLCFVAEERQSDLPQTEGELLAEALEEMVRRRQKQMAEHMGCRSAEFGKEACLRLLEHVAWESWQAPGRCLTRRQAQRAVRGAVRDEDEVRELPRHRPEQLWEGLSLHSGVVLERSREDCRFAVESYREYLAGAYLSQQDDATILKTFGRHVWDPDWTRLIRFMEGRLWRNGREALAERLVRWLIAEHEADRDGRWGRLVREAGWLLAIAPPRRLAALGQLDRRIGALAVATFRCAREEAVRIDLAPTPATTESLCAVLRNGDKETRLWATEALGQLGSERAVMPLLAALRDGDKSVRQSAATALAGVPDTRGVESLRAALCDREGSVARSAAWALGQLGDARAVEVLLRALRDRRVSEKSSVATALGQLGDARAVEPLVMTLRDGSEWTRMSAAQSLGEIGDVRAVEPLIAALQDSDDSVRGSAAMALGHLGGALAMEGLSKAWRAARGRVPGHVMTALAQSDDPRALSELLAALRDCDASVRKSAIRALAELGDTRAVGPLLAVLHDEDASVRQSTASALAQLGDPRAVESLSIALHDEEPSVRKWAGQALGQLGYHGALKAMENALRDEDESVRSWVADALGELGDAGAVDPLLAALQDPAGWVRGSAAGALGQLGDVRAVEPLLAALQDSDGWVRGSAASALGQLGDVRAVEPLLAALCDEDAGVRSDAVKGLCWLGGPGAVKGLAVALQDSDMMVRWSAVLAAPNTGPAGLVCLARHHWWSHVASDERYALLEGDRIVARTEVQLDPELRPQV